MWLVVSGLKTPVTCYTSVLVRTKPPKNEKHHNPIAAARTAKNVTVTLPDFQMGWCSEFFE
jgi:hypothetical protein